jgi:hypothetical protein
MKLKTIVTIVLLLFVAASVAYLVVGEIGKRPAVEKTADSITAIPPTTNPTAVVPLADKAPVVDPAPAPVKTSPETYIVVYYFHGNYRCVTCRTIEMYTREAINEAFLKELGDGSLHLNVLNMQDPVNEVYVKDFGLEYYIVVLEKVVDGKRVEWKKLEGIWDLLKDKDAFKKYVVNETRAYLKGIKQ